MTSLNHGVVMEAAARNLQREMLRDAADAGGGGERLAYDMQAMGQARSDARGRCFATARLTSPPQDEELEQLHRDRIAQLKARTRGQQQRRTCVSWLR